MQELNTSVPVYIMKKKKKSGNHALLQLCQKLHRRTDIGPIIFNVNNYSTINLSIVQLNKITDFIISQSCILNY